jgi:hypothetical protein
MNRAIRKKAHRVSNSDEEKLLPAATAKQCIIYLEHLTMAATSTARWGKKHASRWLSLPLYWTWKWGCQLPWENADLHTLFINMNYHKKSSTFWADNTDFNPMVNCVLILMPQNMVNQRQTN